VNVLTLLVLLIRTLRLNLEGVSTKVITLGLEEVGGEILGAVTIEPGQGGRETRGWDTEESCLGDNISPAGLSLVDSIVEELVEEKVLKVVVCTVGSGDVLQEYGTDNASSAPHKSNGGLV
jgi:hypothetical protein